MIDNFNQISELLTFNSEDEFYFIQILQRKKDNPEGVHGSNNSSRLIKAYYITSIKQLMELKDEMIHFANYFNARIGINLNKRSFEKTAFNALRKIAEQMHNKDYRNVRRAWNTSCGIHNSVEDKIWLLDLDNVTAGTVDTSMLSFINQVCAPFGLKIIATIPSKSGCHVITKPFDVRPFNKKYPGIGIHKNNPTNLFIP